MSDQPDTDLPTETVTAPTDQPQTEPTNQPTEATVTETDTQPAPASEPAPAPVAAPTPPAPFSLASATRTGARRNAPFTLIYGSEKRGKTTLACSFPDPFLILAGNERPPADIDVATPPDAVAKFEDLMAWLRTLAREKHGHRTVVIDSASRIEPLIQDYVCRTIPTEKGHRAAHIEDYGFGKGYKLADKVWADLVAALSWLNKNKRMGIVVLAHALVRRIEEPLTQPFDAYDMDLQARALNLLKREADAILFLRENTTTTEERDGLRKRTRGQGGKLIYAHTQASPAFTAGCRFPLPEKILIEGEGTGYECLTSAGFPNW